jgi:hypothetical protein
MEPTNHGLKPPKHEPKETYLPLKLVIINTLLLQWKADARVLLPGYFNC